MGAFGRVRGGAVAGAVALTTLFAAPACANDASASAAENGLEPREEASCGELLTTSTGRQINASTSAHSYAREHTGNVGISIFAGQDLGEYSPEFLGTALVNSFRNRGVEAECFVHHEPMPNGTGIRFHIAGLTYPESESYSISEAYSVDTIESLADEAKTAGMLLTASADTPFTNP